MSRNPVGGRSIDLLAISANELWPKYRLNQELNDAFLSKTSSDRRQKLLDGFSKSDLVNP